VYVVVLPGVTGAEPDDGLTEPIPLFIEQELAFEQVQERFDVLPSTTCEGEAEKFEQEGATHAAAEHV